MPQDGPWQQEAAREENDDCRKMAPWRQEAAREENDDCRKMAPWRQEAAREDKRGQEMRDLLRRAFAWEDAHVSFDKAVDGIPPDLRGQQPPGVPYSPWQLVEHLRITQHDILDFCVNPDYQEMKWPDAYWPPAPAPHSAAAWDESLRQYREDRKALEAFATNRDIDLAAKIPHGSGQTYMRELVLVIDHSAYHVGQLVLVRRLLGAWR